MQPSADQNPRRARGFSPTPDALLATVPQEVLVRYSEKQSLPLQQARAHYRELIRYLSAARTRATEMVPSAQIDEAWHNFILFTKLYGPWCEQHLGGLVHHVPGLSSDNNEAAYERTATFMIESRGASADLWPAPSEFTTGNCASKCGGHCAGGCSGGNCTSKT
jgi:hypothetical protein